MAPLTPGSVALGLHLANGDAASAVESLRRQAVAAERAGFDGVALSEHHGGFPAYVPLPTLVIGALLAATKTIWGAPCPTVLPLRNTALVIEELAWLNAAYPGRVGAAFVPGYQSRDFEIVGVDFARRRVAFSDMLPEVVRALSGSASGPLAEDPAILALASSPINVAIGAGGPKGAALAASVGAGLVLGSLDDPVSARNAFEAYTAAGGKGARIIIRRAWIGSPPSFGPQMAAYRAQDPDAILPEVASESIVASGSTGDIVARLVDDCRKVGADALNIRVFSYEEDEQAHLAQIADFGREVLPSLRRNLGWADPGTGNSK
jgi:alkanesulfonate monooxygenase SsuD/methylene tetrahydromethanopterin reductase-like flavin-dependent oxidoreductase (luciferase family)